MKTAANIVSILVAGVVLGLVFRELRKPKDAAGPGPGEVVYEPDVAPGEEPTATKEDMDVPEVVRLDSPPLLNHFELTERSGKQVSTDDLKGQPYVLSFFFTTCPSICPQQNQRIQKLQDEFAGEPIRFVSVTCDPEKDTPEVLTEYAARYGADKDQWLFLTGDLDYIRQIGVDMFRQPIAKGFHTEKLVLVDAEGNIEGMYVQTEPVHMKKLREAMRSMIEAKPSGS